MKWKNPFVDVVKLSDEDMALQSLIENLQREGLNDADRGDGIKNYVILREKAGFATAVAKEEIAPAKDRPRCAGSRHSRSK